MAGFTIRTVTGSRKVPCATDMVQLGRADDAGLRIENDALVSRQHAIVERRHDGWWIRDCGSRNGTRVNGTRIFDPVPLRDGAEIQLGATVLVFHEDYQDPNATAIERDTAQTPVQLSEREREVVACVAGGLTDKEIAARLNLSLATVRSHLERIRDKSGRRRRAELTQLAHELGLEATS